MHPLACWVDNTGELASLLLRGGGAGSNTAADLIGVLAEAIAQVPKAHRRRLLVTSDAAGASHELIDWLVRQNHAADRCVEFSVGFDVDADVRAAIGQVRADCWVPALDNTDGTTRDDADVAEVTALMQDRLARTGWPRRLRVIVRRTRLAPGEQPTLFHLDGYKHSCFVTTTATLNVQLLDARHRAHARVEDQVRTTKDTERSRRVRGLPRLGESGSWNIVWAGIRRSCGSGRCGWWPRFGRRTGRSGRRLPRLRRSWVSGLRRRCVAGCVGPRLMVGSGRASRATRRLSWRGCGGRTLSCAELTRS